MAAQEDDNGSLQHCSAIRPWVNARNSPDGVVVAWQPEINIAGSIPHAKGYQGLPINVKPHESLYVVRWQVFKAVIDKHGFKVFYSLFSG